MEWSETSFTETWKFTLFSACLLITIMKIYISKGRVNKGIHIFIQKLEEEVFSLNLWNENYEMSINSLVTVVLWTSFTFLFPCLHLHSHIYLVPRELCKRLRAIQKWGRDYDLSNCPSFSGCKFKIIFINSSVGWCDHMIKHSLVACKMCTFLGPSYKNHPRALLYAFCPPSFFPK